MTVRTFFFYGSWTEGFVHYERLRNFIRGTEAAQIQGSAYRLAVGYPVVLNGGQDWIKGTLMNLEVSEFLVQLLDQFHGVNPMDESKALYHRREVEVRTAHGTQMATTYFVNPAKLPKTATMIKDGNWEQSLAQEEPLPAKLTDRQREYIAKLGNVSGREIIPIQDLSLYRELMKLELIVDKGRRLALSKLGHEVCQYLG